MIFWGVFQPGLLYKGKARRALQSVANIPVPPGTSNNAFCSRTIYKEKMHARPINRFRICWSNNPVSGLYIWFSFPAEEICLRWDPGVQIGIKLHGSCIRWEGRAFSSKILLVGKWALCFHVLMEVRKSRFWDYQRGVKWVCAENYTMVCHRHERGH